jgi:hypothetical protein
MQKRFGRGTTSLIDRQGQRCGSLGFDQLARNIVQDLKLLLTVT